MATVNLIAVGELLGYLQVPAPPEGDAKLDLAQRIIAGVTGAVERVTGQTLGQQTVASEKRNGNGRPFIYLLKRPVVSISSIKQDGTAVGVQSQFNARTGRVTLQNFQRFTEGWQNWDFAYVAGLGPVAFNGTPDFPEDMKLRAKVICAELWKQATEQRFGVSATAFGGQSINFYVNDGVKKRVEKEFSDWILPVELED